MPYQNPNNGYSLPDGLYLMRRWNEEKRITHFAVLDVGNIFSFSDIRYSQPVIVHQTPPSIQREYLNDNHDWFVEFQVDPQNWEKAIERYNEARHDPQYAALSNNCEQFARYVTQGEKRSYQVEIAVLATAAIGVLLSSQNEKRR